MEYPTITLAMVKSRHNDYPEQAINSMKRIIYPQCKDKVNIDIYDNKTKYPAIGFNKLVRRAKGEWIFFIGDDDKVARTTPFNYGVYLITNEEKSSDSDNVVCISGNIILFDDEGKKRQHLQSCPTGMWNVEYLKKNPFDETLERYVDTEMFSRTIHKNNKLILYAATDYGYYYRQHDNNISYNKFEEKTGILREIIQRNKKQGEIGGISG